MLYTSGTTGHPKGCLLSHDTLAYKARVYLDLHEWTAEDRCLVAVPYFHIFGALGGIVANTLAGSTQVLMDVFEPEAALRAARLTDGDVDPTVGQAMRVLGYDRDFAAVARRGRPVVHLARVPGWHLVAVDHAAGTVQVPAGVRLDLGATADRLEDGPLHALLLPAAFQGGQQGGREHGAGL